ncbi:MAG: RimK family alpha-L-glutamate ligase [Thermoanaerobaculales bacterium]|nr:RimK family alpha-L-glutamate ligase [Thermoanaerobaculales bacterium]
MVLSARPGTASNRRLAEAARAAAVDLQVVDATALVAGSDGELWRGAVRERDELPRGVLARVGNWRPDSLLAVLETVTARGAATPNPAPAVRVGRDHWRTIQVLAAAGLPVPLTVVGADPEVLAATVGARLDMPVVVKQRRSRMGIGVIRCERRDQLEAVLDSLWRVGDELLVQRCVDSGGSSIRCLVVGAAVVAAARFSATGTEWRSNAARGGRVESISPDQEMIDLAVTAAETIGLGICGVDLLPGKDGVVVGEVNPTPGFVSLESATGRDVAAAILAHLIEIS